MGKLERNAKITVEVACGVKAGDAVLVVTQKNTKPPYGDELLPVARALAGACLELGAIPTIMDIDEWAHSPAFREGRALPIVEAAVASADVVINAVDRVSFTRLSGEKGPDTKARASGEKGWFVLQSHKMAEWDITAEQIAMIAKRSRWLARLIDGCKTLKVTSPAGTDVSFNLEGGVTVLPYLWLVPLFGEVPVVPLAATGDGVMIVDGPTQKSVRPKEELDREPLRIELAEGRATAYSGDPAQVARLEEFIDGGAPRADQVDEIGIVTTDVEENSLYWWEDGTHHVHRIHIALGNNLLRGDTVHGKSHMDCEIIQPTVTVDGLVVVRDGVFADESIE
jgi:2,5-dihydroxypyridine 5,6-dioxygenase